jgi:Protein of unknown function (DUF3727)
MMTMSTSRPLLLLFVLAFYYGVGGVVAFVPLTPLYTSTQQQRQGTTAAAAASRASTSSAHQQYHHNPYPSLLYDGRFYSSSLSFTHKRYNGALQASASSSSEPSVSLRRVSDDHEDTDDTPIPFIDKINNSFIECYADTVATINDGTNGEVEYTIGVPCDYCVSLCYHGDDDQLVPIELEDELMDDVFLVAENIVSEEFGEELALQRTPQTLTLVGELEDDDDDEDEDDDDDDDDEYSGDEVEVLLSFEHRDKEFSLVRLVDPVLIVGKEDPERPDIRLLLTPEESSKVMPLLENAFLEFHDDDEDNDML